MYSGTRACKNNLVRGSADDTVLGCDDESAIGSYCQRTSRARIAQIRSRNNGIEALKWVDGGARAFHHTRSYVTCPQCVTSASIARHRGGIVALRWMAGGERGQAFIRYVPAAAGKAARPRVAHRAA